MKVTNQTSFHLELTEEEAAMLCAVVGNVTGHNKIRSFTSDLYFALNQHVGHGNNYYEEASNLIESPLYLVEDDEECK